MRLPLSTITEPPATDVPIDDVYAPYIKAVWRDAGIMLGYEDGSFNGESAMRRAEVTAVAWRMLGNRE